MVLMLKVVVGGDLTISLLELYTLLRGGAVLKGPYAYITVNTLDVGNLVEYSIRVPEVTYCPSDEPVRIYVDDVLSRLCIEVYKYFEGRCVACVVKVYSVVYEEWLVNEATIMKILEAVAKYGLPSEFRNGSIVITTCPKSYEEALRLGSESYREGLEKLRQLILEVT